MAITLDTIVNKVFKIDKNGYDKNEVESFLDEILEEMENREAETERLKKQIESLNGELADARNQLAQRPVVQETVAPAAAPAPVAMDRYATESFELVLSKAKGAYEEIVAAADARAAEIVEKAEADAAGIRTAAEDQISDLTAKYATLRKQTADYYASVKKAAEEQTAALEQIKKLL